MPKMTPEQIRDVANIAAQYIPGEGQQKKDSLRKKITMAIAGKHYKTPAAKRAKAKTAELEGKLKPKRKETYATKMHSKKALQSITKEELEKFK